MVETREVGGFVDGAVEDGRRLARAEGPSAGRRVAQDASQREHVTGRAHLPAVGQGLFGREVARGADDDVGRGQRRRVRAPRDAEVDQPGPVPGEQDVARFDVAVHESGRVHLGQGLRQPRAEHGHGVLGQRTVRIHRLGERRLRERFGRAVGDHPHHRVGQPVDGADGGVLDERPAHLGEEVLRTS
ncbi:hypothetical protein GCM10010121_081590 [Streptomyces brasiliensis]|uniref:Uncharacterized protein n=1 Tax=Streptomyces brasiliensis TaxID=1954 RepID=A0A917LCR8_9ACTN|nr:hypothetical protein GCM10010121_081590 [Streptomyces brasiliensis]